MDGVSHPDVCAGEQGPGAGNRLVDEKGEPVRLRGVNCASLEWSSNKNQAIETWIGNMKTAAARFSIIISEFGGAYYAPGTEPPRKKRFGGFSGGRRNDGDWLLRVMQAIEDNGWSYTAWDLHAAAGPTLVSDWNYTTSPAFGVYVQQMLRGKLPAYRPPAEPGSERRPSGSP